MRDLALRQSKILIIDDDPSIVEVLRHVLEDDGYREIESTTNPAAAALLFTEFQPDLVMLDLVMPEVSGLQVLSQLRAMIPRDTYLPILVVTGDRAKETRREALARGASDFVAKPYDITEIRARVGHMLETRYLHLQPLLESKRFLQSTLDALSSHVAILDEHGVIIAVNEAWKRFARENGVVEGFSGVGGNYLQLCDAATGNFSEGAAAMAGGIRAVMAGQRNEFLLEYPCDSSQEQRWFLVRVTRFGGDGPTRVVVAHENVTKRKLAEEALRASEAQLRAIFEASPDCVKIVSRAGQLLEINPAGLRLIEADHLAAVPGNAVDQLVHHSDLAAFVGLHERVSRGETGQLQYRITGFKGTERWLEAHSVPLREPDGVITSVLSVTRDITDKRLVEEALRGSEANLAAAQRVAHLGSWELDVSHSDDGVAVPRRWSDELFRIAGYAPGEIEVTRKSYFRLIPEEEHELIRRTMSAAICGGTEYAVVHQIIRKDGEKRAVRATGRISFDGTTGRPLKMIGTTQDITEQRRGEESIRLQAHMLDSVGQAVIATDLEGCISYANRFAGELYGWSPGEMFGRNILEVTVPQVSREQADEIMQHLRRGESWSGEFLVHRRDGQPFPAFVTNTPLFDNHSCLTGIIGISNDISERKSAEVALRDAERKYRSIFDNAVEGIFQNTPEGALISANPALARMLRFDSPEELICARTDLARQSYAEPTQREEFRRRLEAQSVVTNFEYEVKCSDGSLIWVSENVRVVRDAAGKALYYEGSVQDITARRRSEDELFRSRETLRGILDSIPQCIFWKDLDLVYLGCNRALSLKMGLNDPAEVIGKSDLELIWREMAEIYRADDRMVIDLDTPKISFEEPGIAPDGSPRWLRTSKTPLHDQEGRVYGVLGTFEDVTAHTHAKLEIERLNADLEERVVRRTEELFAATWEAERANRAKSEFLSRTSHELRTPLNAILGFAQLVDIDEGLARGTRESIQEILSAGRHLLTLVNELLNLSSAESGHLPFSLEPVAVESLVEETLRLVRPHAATGGIELELVMFPTGGQRVLADRQRLKEALLNLLSNAIKYNRPGGKVVVQFAHGETGAPPALRLLVRDTGPGISAEHLPRLFTPFDRLDVERTRADITGVGLGLALAKRIVELIGGRLGVESTPGEGSVFWIEVPLVEDPVLPSDQNALTPPVHPETQHQNSGTFLYIDRNASNFRLIARIVARRPAIRLLTATTGSLGLESADEHCPDLILLDGDLPDGNSAEMLARLRANPHTADIPVAIFSADLPPEKREQMTTVGVRAFLPKPLEMRALLGVLDQFIGSRSTDAASGQ